MPRDDKLPYFQFYPDDFTSDGKVEAMSTTGVGAYMLLLCKAWREEPIASLPDDDAILARWSRLTPEEWQSHKTEILSAFTLRDDGRWYQCRLEREFEKVLEQREKKKKAGQAGANARWSKIKNKGDGTANAVAMRKNAILSSSLSTESLSKTPLPPVAELPSGFHTPEFTKAWSEWLLHRREIKKKQTPTAAKRQMTLLARMGHDRAIAAIHNSIAQGYTGIYEAGSKEAKQGEFKSGAEEWLKNRQEADDVVT